MVRDRRARFFAFSRFSILHILRDPSPPLPPRANFPETHCIVKQGRRRRFPHIPSDKNDLWRTIRSSPCY